MYQWAFLIFLYLIGLLYINVLFPNLSNNHRQLLSPFFGVGFSGVVVGFLLIARIPLSLPYFFICLLLILIFAKILLKILYLHNLSWGQLFAHTSSNVLSISFVLYLVISCFFVLSGFADASPDSTQFEATGRYLAQGGLVNSSTPQMAFMLNGRLLIVGAMHAMTRLFGGYSLYALNPTMCVWLLLFLAYTIFILNRKVDNVTRILLLLFFVITLGFYKHFFNGMFAIHSNQLSMIFFTVSIVSLYFFTVTEEKSWVYIGSLTIGFACLTRVDMLLCSLIFFFLLTLIRKTDYNMMKYAWYIFFVSLLPWRAFTLYYTPLNTWYVNATQLYLLIGANIILCLLSTQLHRYNRTPVNLIRKSPFIVGPIIIFLLIFFIPEKVELSWNLFIKYILLGHSTWLLLVISLLMSASSFFYIVRSHKNYYVLFTPLVLYLFLLFLLVIFSAYEKEDHSANRMVFHTVPLFIYSLFIGLSYTINHESKSSEHFSKSRDLLQHID